MKSDGMRVFVAIRPPPSVVEALVGLASRLSEEIHGRWVPAEQMHLTLRFDPAVPADAVTRLAEAMRGVATAGEPFDLSLGVLGAFPSPRRAKVLWVAPAATSTPLRGLHGAIEREARSLGLPPETRPFRPHLTLARFRGRHPDLSRRVEELSSSGGGGKPIFGAAARPSDQPVDSIGDTRELRFRVGSIRLWQSVLASGGARYRELGVWPLGGPEAGRSEPWD